MQLARVRPWQVHVRGDIASLRNMSKQKQRVGKAAVIYSTAPYHGRPDDEYSASCTTEIVTDKRTSA
jgi:hypothetical protein